VILKFIKYLDLFIRILINFSCICSKYFFIIIKNVSPFIIFIFNVIKFIVYDIKFVTFRFIKLPLYRCIRISRDINKFILFILEIYAMDYSKQNENFMALSSDKNIRIIKALSIKITYPIVFIL